MDRPNIVYLHSHDTGRCIGAYGFAARTPHIDRIAAQGLRFTNAFAAAPTCSPSRAALLTGSWPHSCGMIGLAHRGSCLFDYGTSLINVLGTAGFRTAVSGMTHIAADPAAAGYQAVLHRTMASDPDDDAAVARAACRFLEQPHDRPFLLNVGFYSTHRTGRGQQGFNWDASPTGDPSRPIHLPPLPDSHPVRQDLVDFRAAVERFDACVGQVFESLRCSRHADNTLIVLTTDHGPPFPGMKCTLTDAGLGVMLILHGPRRFGIPGGRTIDAMVSQIDLAPTLYEITGVAAPPTVQGRSLLPLIQGRVNEVRELLFAEVNYHAAYEPMHCVRSKRYKYIQRFHDLVQPVLANCDDSLTKQYVVRHGWPRHLLAPRQFYDLALDPHETVNRIADPALAGEREAARAALRAHMQRTDDPLLNGQVPRWPGMRLNAPTDFSCQDPPQAESRILPVLSTSASAPLRGGGEN